MILMEVTVTVNYTANKKDFMQAIHDGVHTALSEIISEDDVFNGMNEAISNGVQRAFRELFRNGTDMPGHDFFDAIARGVKEAHLELQDN